MWQIEVRIRRAFIWLVALYCGSSQAQIHIYGQARVASPAIAIEKLDSDWSTVGSGRYAQALGRSGLEITLSKSWLVGVESRFDYVLHFSEETAQFYKKLENNDLPAGQYPLSLSVNAVVSRGFFTKYFIPLSSRSSFSLTGYALQPLKVQDGQLDGLGEVSEDGSYQYSYNLDYAYDSNKLFEHQGEGVSGWGHSFDFSYLYRGEAGWSYGVELKDVFYQFYWQTVNRDKGCYSRPLGSCDFRTEQVSKTQQLPFSQQYTLTKSLSSDSSVKLQAYNWSRQQALSVSGQWFSYDFGLDLLSRAIQFGYESDMVRLQLASDQYRLSKSKFWQASVDFYWPFL